MQWEKETDLCFMKRTAGVMVDGFLMRDQYPVSKLAFYIF